MNHNIDSNCCEELLSKFGSPLYVYFEEPMRENAKEFMNAFKRCIPNFEQYFAVKATPNIHIMSILKTEGMGFDCSSINELKLVDKLFDDFNDTVPAKIMYTSNYTSVEDFEFLLRTKFQNSNLDITINLDDIDGLENLCEASKNININLPDLISFRLNPLFGPIVSEVESNILGGSNTKFGIPSTKIIEAYKMAQDKGFSKFGIHVMTGSCVLDVNYFVDLVNVVFNHVSLIHDTLGIKFEFVDFGGGIGIPYKPTEKKININELAEKMSNAIEENKIKYNLNFDPKIIMENGRYITGPYGILLTKCKSIKKGIDDKKFYGLDACMANLMRPGMYGAYHEILIPKFHCNETTKTTETTKTIETTEEMDTESANVVGTLCENNDWFAKDRNLPKGIQKNDVFLISDVGAHGYSMGFQYNSKTRSAEVLINKFGEAIEIRKKETMCFY